MKAVSYGAVWALSAGVCLGCDALPADDADGGVDASQPVVVDGLRVVGLCPAAAGALDFDFVLTAGGSPVEAETLLDGFDATAGDTLRFDDFSFRLPPVFDDIEAGSAVVEDAMRARRTLTLEPTQLTYDPIGGADGQGRARLVVFMLDHSGSLVGVDPATMMFDPTQASDRDDIRISFFQQLTGALLADDEASGDATLLSVVSFSGDSTHITPEASTPVRNGSAIREALGALQFDESGETPLTRALVDVRQRIIAPNADADPLVILFTDGVEDGDPTDVDGAFDRAVADYAGADGAPIPVIVLHLQPPAAVRSERRGRNPRLLDLACRSGGEYIFLERETALIEDAGLLASVVARARGRWRLSTDREAVGEALAPGGWLLSTRLELTLGGATLAHDMERAPPLPESRVFFTQP